MIEEEDDEEILEKGISWKSVLKNLFVIVMIILGALIIYMGSGEDMFFNFTIGFMLICVASTVLQIQKQPQEPLRQTLSIMVCAICGLVKVRNYQAGDFVFKEAGKCEKCDVPLKIKQIYSVKLKKPTESEPEEEKKDLPKSVKEK